MAADIIKNDVADQPSSGLLHVTDFRGLNQQGGAIHNMVGHKENTQVAVAVMHENTTNQDA